MTSAGGGSGGDLATGGDPDDVPDDVPEDDRAAGPPPAAVTAGGTAASHAGTIFGPSLRGLTIALVASVTLVGSEILAVATVMPAVGDDLGRAGYGLAFSLFSVGSIVGVLLAGPATDRIGPWRPYLLGMALFAGGLAVGAAAPHMAVLVSGRLLQGLGAGAIPAVSYAVIGTTYPEAVRPRMLAVLSTAWVLPGVIGPGIAGVVAEQFGWRWVFGGLLPLVVLAAGLAARPLGRLPAAAPAGPGVSARAGERGTLPVLDAIRFAAGVGLLIGAIDRAHLLGAGPLTQALAMAALGVVVAARPSQRLLPPGWWRVRRGIAAAVVTRAMLAYAFVAADAFIPLVLTDVRGRSLTFASLAVSIGTLTWSAGSWVADRTVGRLGPDRLAPVGGGLVAAGVAVQVLLLVGDIPLPLGLLGVPLASLGMGMAFTPLAMLVLDQHEQANTGVASSWMSLFELLGFAFGPAVGGSLVAANPEQPALAEALGVAFLAGALVAASTLLLRRRLHRLARPAIA
ncbi:MAG: MFS transporter [Acidimicrobiia bacterium]